MIANTENKLLVTPAVNDLASRDFDFENYLRCACVPPVRHARAPDARRASNARLEKLGVKPPTAKKTGARARAAAGGPPAGALRCGALSARVRACERASCVRACVRACAASERFSRRRARARVTTMRVTGARHANDENRHDDCRHYIQRRRRAGRRHESDKRHDRVRQGRAALRADAQNCEKIHYIAPNIYCCGAGTSADTENTTGALRGGRTGARAGARRADGRLFRPTCHAQRWSARRSNCTRCRPAGRRSS